jgi:NAD(P)-dependent dehydrogenase (short-subunit alcohol dehydrogenase family)
MTRLLVLGATGDVGRGIVREATRRGWTVVASSRHVSQCTELDLPGVTRIPADGTVAADLDRLVQLSDATDLDAVIVATSPTTARIAPGAETGTPAFVGYVADTLWPHHAALSAFLPHLRPGALFLGIGGGMADLVLRGYGHVSAAQAAQRMLYRSTAKEAASGVVRELMIRSMVTGDSNRDRAPAEWLTDAEIGRHVCDLVAEEHDARGDPVWELVPQAAS